MLAERLRLALRSPIRIAGQEIVLTGSIGIAVYDGTSSDGRDLLREAEVAMYRAKRAGSDRIEIFKPEMRAEKDERIAIESDLRRAIEHAAAEPALSADHLALERGAGRLRGAWCAGSIPNSGCCHPAEFVPVAEETDLIVQLGSYVLGRAVADIARWQKELPRPEQPLFVSVNISSRQLIKPDLVQEIRHVIGAGRAPRATRCGSRSPNRWSWRIPSRRRRSSSCCARPASSSRSTTSAPATRRSPISIASRSTRSRSTRRWCRLERRGDSNAVIVRSIVALAHELGKKIVAEGVETRRGRGIPALDRLPVRARASTTASRCRDGEVGRLLQADPQGRPAHAPPRPGARPGQEETDRDR